MPIMMIFVLLVIALIVITGLFSGRQVQSSGNLSTAETQIGTMSSQIESLYAQQGTFSGLTTAMVLFAGSPGSGKTTAASSMMVDRLEQIGGFAWTAENPVEYHLQGSHGNPDTAFVTSRVVQQLAATMGIHLRLSQEVGTPERLYSLLDAAGFVDIEIHVEPDGHFLTMEQALAAGPDYEFPAPGQYPPPLRACTSMQMASLREAYEQSMRAACTPQGIWNDCTSLLARARRP